MEITQIFDVIIIGGGPAGISAAMWCDELGLNSLLLESNNELGGQLLWTYNSIKNYLGVETENGREMRDIFVNQLNLRKFVLKTNSEVIDIDVKNKQVFLKNGEIFQAKAIVIATGIKRRKLGAENEDNYKNCGIIESGKRDGKLITGKKVAIVGGGDAALENVLILSETASEITLIHRRQDFSARKEFTEQVLANNQVRILTNSIVTKINGDEKIQSLEIKDLTTGENTVLSIDALLIRIGVEPNTHLFQKKLEMDEMGFIKVDSRCETNIKNIFSIGDVANPLSPTINSSVGMGTTAIKIIFQKIGNSK